MTDYNDYITAVNKIFDYLAKMKAGWNNMDNMNYIESIEEYKDKVISNAEKFKQPAPVSVEKPEALDDKPASLPEGDTPKVDSLSTEEPKMESLSEGNELKVEESEEASEGVADDSLEALGDD